MASAYQSSSRKSQHRHFEVGIGAKLADIELGLTYNESRSFGSSPQVIQMTDHALLESNELAIHQRRRSLLHVPSES